MQKEIREIYLQKIEEGLEKLEDRHRVFFNRLYPDGLENIADDYLDTCLRQVTNTLDHLNKI